jgi:hypothetical protein
MAKARRIICEGESDKKFFEKLFEVHHLEHFVVQPIPAGRGGRTNFGYRLRGLIQDLTRSPEVASSALIVVGDNDSNAVTSFGIVTDQIRQGASEDGEYVYGIPTEPRQIVPSQGGLPDVCVLMLPWDAELGALETLCYVAATTCCPAVAGCVDTFVPCVGADGWEISNRSKLQMQCYLSARCEQHPNTQLTQAWSSTRPQPLVPLDHPCFTQIVTFLRDFPVSP